nr:bacterio-opsin activator domain-containing protein [Natrononativus amylolyticus]
MTSQHQQGPIVLVSDRDRSDLYERLRTATDRSVTSVTATGEFSLPIEGARGVVIELDCPDRTRRVLERISAAETAVPTVVAPRNGSERLAATALQAGATEYVPSDVEEPADRVLEALASANGTRERTTVESTAREDGEATSDDRLDRVFSTTLPDEAFVISEDGTYLEANTPTESANMKTAPADQLVGERLDDVFPDDVADRLQECVERTLETNEEQSIEYKAATEEGLRWFEGKVIPADERVAGERAVIWLARDITQRAKRERDVRQHRDRLETLDRINVVVRQVIQTLVEAPTRSTIEQEVCERLVDSELYCGSWIGELAGEGTVHYRTGAGEAETFIERVSDLSTDRERPVVTAMQTGEIMVDNEMLQNPEMPAGLQEAAQLHDIRSAIAVPISYDNAVYGVLAVLATREDAFGGREQDAFRLLGETIGFAINAVKNRRLLFSDAVVELELRISGGDTFSFDLSEEHDCSAYLEWTGTNSNGRVYQYVTFEGIDGQTVLEKASAHESIEECRLIHDGDDRCTIEIRLHESGVRTLTDHGVTIRDITVSEGSGTVIVEVPRDADVREIVDAMKRVYEDTELVARREIDQPVQTAIERREGILDRLTDRQLTALRLAYYGGYFDWPRGSTGEEIAEAMDVTPPTMHQHLRRGLYELLSEFFEEGGGTG